MPESFLYHADVGILEVDERGTGSTKAVKSEGFGDASLLECKLQRLAEVLPWYGIAVVKREHKVEVSIWGFTFLQPTLLVLLLLQ